MTENGSSSHSRAYKLAAIAAVIVIPTLSIVIPNFGCTCDFSGTREKSYASAMKSALRDLVFAEEAHFAKHAAYTSSLESLGLAASEVTLAIGSATGTGWSATAKHARSTKTCGIFVGNATALRKPLWVSSPPTLVLGAFPVNG